MSDCFMQQDTGATGTHYDRHLTAFRFYRLEEDRGFLYSLFSHFTDDIVGQELGTHTECTGCVGVFYLAVIFHDTNSSECNHRTVIVIHLSFRVTEKDM